MKDEFYAKDIIKMLRLTRQRYDYIANRIGIEPDLERGEGHGSPHTYSFRNVLQFAIVQNLNRFGLSPNSIRHVLADLEKRTARQYEEHFFPRGRNTKKLIQEAKDGYFSPDTREELYLAIELQPEEARDGIHGLGPYLVFIPDLVSLSGYIMQKFTHEESELWWEDGYYTYPASDVWRESMLMILNLGDVKTRVLSYFKDR